MIYSAAATASSSSGNSSYDFIMKPNTPKKSGNPFGAGSSKQSRIMVVIIGIVGFILLSMIASYILTRASKQTTARMVSIAQEQQELMRIADIGTSKARTSAAKDFAVNVRLSIDTSQKEILALLKKRGHKLNIQLLSKKKNAKTDQLLNEAFLTNRFDDTFSETVRGQLLAYRQRLQETYKGSTNKTEKEVLAKNFKDVSILLGLDTTDNTSSSSQN